MRVVFGTFELRNGGKWQPDTFTTLCSFGIHPHFEALLVQAKEWAAALSLLASVKEGQLLIFFGLGEEVISHKGPPACEKLT